MITRQSISICTIALCSALTLVACNKSDPAAEISTANALKTTAKNIDSTAVRSAEIAFRHFLDASREGSATHDSLAALIACGDDNGTSYFPTTLLAGYSLLPFDMHGDTVVARASVVTVAEQDVDHRNNGFTARQRVREDLLEWDVIPTGEPDRWVVCNGLRFGYLGADSLTVWRPEGASYTTAMQLVDSVMKARGN